MISDLPGLLTTGTKHIPLSRGRISAVAVARIGFPTWNGIAPTSTWGRKPVIGPTDVPFAELAIAAHLRQRGWASGWVYRQLRFLESWEPRRHAVFPPESLDLFGKISRAAGSGGGWDVYAWRNGEPLFVEVKWPSDRIRESQRRWLLSALDLGVRSEAFILLECELLPNKNMKTRHY